MSRDVKPLRTFGLLVGGIFLLLGTWPMIAHGLAPRIWALAAAVLLLGPAFVYPRALGPAHRVWNKFGQVLGWINTRIVLAIIFYVIFTPIGLVLRWLGQDTMRRRFDQRVATYRLERDGRPASHLRHQF